MNFMDAFVLSAVEGFTEFLPISSTGHLILASEFLRIDQTDFLKSFEIIIQTGAILAIVVIYWRTLTNSTKIWSRIITALLPTGVAGFILYDFTKASLIGNSNITIAALLLGGIILILLELLYKEKEHHVEKIEDISLPKAFLIGVFQAIAIVPGVSRAGATIIGALFLGAKRKTATEFSFFLAVPTIAAASLLDAFETNILNYSSNEYLLLLVGFVGSFIFALAAVKFLLEFIKTHTFIPFGIYRIILAVLFWLFVIK